MHPDPSRGGVAERFASGRIVGGSGSINAMVCVRGRRSDYDDWAATGCDGWSYDDVLPHFRAIENWVDGADEYRGDAGPISVSWCGHDHPSTTRSSPRPSTPDTSRTRTTTAHRRRVCPRVRLISDEGSGRRRRGVYAPRPTRLGDHDC